MRIFIIATAMITVLPIFGQTESKSVQILKNVFSSYEVKDIRDKKVFETKVWEKHASIPLNNCFLIELGNGITGLAFNIYLSDDPDQYRYMSEEGIGNMTDVDETNLFQGGGERLIQVIFYDLKNNKFIAKGDGFPLSGFSWIPGGYGDMMEINEINSFEKTNASNNTCILNIIECPDCLGGLHYVFKFHNGKVFTSSPIDGCYETIIEEGNKLYINMITNCYEYEYDGESPKLEKEFLFAW